MFHKREAGVRRNDPVARAAQFVVEQLETRVLLNAMPPANQPTWIEQGPGPILGGQTAGLLFGMDAVAGAVDVVAPDPSNLDRVFIGTVNGGVWRTTDATSIGPRWVPLTQNRASLSITDLKFSPLDPTNNTLFAGTGQRSSGKRDIAGRWPAGMLRTTNASAEKPTWTAIGTQLAGQNIRRIIPTKIGADLAHQVVLVATNKGLYRSTDGGVKFSKVSESTGTGLPKGAVSELIADPLNDQLFYLAVPGKGIYRSIINTGGAKWERISDSISASVTGTMNIGLSLHRTATASFLWAGLMKNTGTAAAPSHQLTNVFRYSTAAGTWNQFLNPPAIHPGGQADTHFSMLADKDDAGVVYIAGDTRAASPFVANIFRGNIGGQLWVPIVLDDDPATASVKEGAAGTAPHADSRFMIFHGNDILEADDGGIYRLVKPNSEPALFVGRYWESVNGNLRPNETYSIGYDSVNDVIIGGSQDTGSWQQNDNDISAGQVLQGDGFIQAVDDGFGAGPVWRYRMGNTFNSFFRQQYDSSNQRVGTEQRVMLAAAATPGNALSGLTVDDLNRATGANRVVTTRPFAINAVSSARMLLGWWDLYESTDGGMTITQISPAGIGIVTAVAAGGGRQGIGSASAGYVGDDRGQMFIRKDGQAAFTKSSSFPGSTKQPVRSIIVDQLDWKKAYVVTRTNVYRTTNGGDSWTTITGNLGKLTGAFQTVELFHDVATPNVEVVLVGARGGVFRCSNPSAGGSAKWSKFGTGMPNAVVSDLELGENFTLVAATFGRGVWKIKKVNAALVAGATAATRGSSKTPVAAAAADDPVIVSESILQITGDDSTNLNDSIRLVRNADNPLMLDVYLNNTSNLPDLSVELAAIEKIVVQGGAGDDTLILDHANGLVSVESGIDFDGGAGTNSKQDANFYSIPTSLKDGLLSGLQKFVGWTSRLSDLAAVVRRLPGIESSLTDALGVGDGSAPITGGLQQGFYARILNYFADDLTPTAQEMVDFVKSISSPIGLLELVVDPDSVRGGLISLGSSQRLEFGLNLQINGEKNDIAIDPGLNGDQYGLQFDASATVDMAASFGLDFRFGFDLTPGLSVEDAFYVSINDLRLSGLIRGTKLDFAVKAGFLDAGVRGGTIDLSALIRADFVNPDQDDQGVLTLSELFGGSVSSLVELTATGKFNATLPISAKLGGFQTNPNAKLRITSDDVFSGAAPVVTTENIDDLLGFNSLSSASVLSLLRQLGDYLDSVRHASVFDTKIPFTDTTLGDVMDFRKALTNKLTGLLQDADGKPKFESAQELADLLVVELGLDPSIVKANYDATTKELTYHVSFNDIVASLAASLDLGSLSLGSLASIGLTGGQVTLDASVAADFEFGLKLRAAGSEFVGGIDAPTNGNVAGGLEFMLRLDDETPVSIVVAEDATNTTIDDLVADINAAIALAGLGDAIIAARQGNRIKFATRGSDTGREIALTATAGSAILTQLGFTDGQSDEFDLSQQFFIENASLGASISLSAKDIDAAAKLGFVGIGIDNGSGNAVASVEMNLFHPEAPATAAAGGTPTISALVPNHPRRLSFADLVDAIQNGNVGKVIRPPGKGTSNTEIVRNVSGRSLNQVEAAIAVDPTNPNRVFVASNSNNQSGSGTPLPGLFAAYSTDGGNSWNSRLIATESDDHPACCDPTVVFDRFGNLYLGYMNSTKDAVVILKSTDGGQTFQHLHTFNDGADQPTLATGPSSSDPNAATVWVAYLSSGGNIKTSGLTVTNAAIGTFSAAVPVQGSLEGNFADIAVGPRGEVAVGWERAVFSLALEKEGIVYVNVDPDGLGPQPFGNAKTVFANINVGPKEKIPAQPTRGFSSNVDLGFDLSGSKRRGRLYLVYTDERVDESQNTDINSVFSDDNGKTWSNVVRVNDDGGAASQFLPKMAVDPTTGNVAVVWHDTRLDSMGNDEARFFGAVSYDGGASFRPNFEVGTVTSDQAKANPSAAFDDLDYGDYAGVDFYNGKIHAAWADVVSRGAGAFDFDIHTARVNVTTAAASSPIVSSSSSGFTTTAAGLSDLFAFTGSINFVLPLKLTADFATIDTDASIVLDWPDFNETFDPSKHLHFNGMESLTDLKDLSFDDVMGALRALLGYLRGLKSFSVLNAEIPLLDRSINDLLDYAEEFAAKIDQLQANEQGTLQDVQQYIQATLGLPIKLSIDTADANHKALKIELDPSATYNGDPININLALPDLSLVGADLAAQITNLQANATLGLDLGIDLNTLDPFLYESTSVSLKAGASVDIDFSATLLGLIGVFVRGGKITLDRDGIPLTPDLAQLKVSLLPKTGGRYLFTDVHLGGTNNSVRVTFDAALKADLPIFAPTPTDPISPQNSLKIDLSHTGDFDGDLDIDAAVTLPDWDLDAIIDSLDFTGDLSSLLNGIHTLLGFVKQGLESEVLSKKLPLVGDKLKSGANFIESIRTAIQALNDEPDNSYATIQTRLAQVLGPLVDMVTITPTVTTIGQAEFLIRLKKNVVLNPNFDLNLPALGLGLTGAVRASLDFDFALGVGVTQAGGVYIKTDANGAAPELNVLLNVTIPGTQFTGDLGILRVKVNDEDDNQNGRASTLFTGNFAVDLVDPSGGDNRFSLVDLQNRPAFSDVVKAKLTADAKVRLEMAIDFGDATRFPSFSTDFDLDWSFGNVATTVADSSFGAIDRIEFKDVKLMLGTYLSGFAAPIIQRAKDVLSPLRPMIDFLSKEIEALASINAVRDFFDKAPNGNGDKKVTVGEVIKRLSIGTPALKFIDAAKFILDLSVPSLGGNVAISLGGFNLSPSIRNNTNLTGVNPSAVSGPSQTIDQQIQGLSDAATKEFLNKLKSDQLGGTTATGDRGKPQFPLLQQPTTAFKLLMGQDVDLFLWEMPRFDASLFIQRDFPILGPLEVTFSGGVKIFADIGFGYDTTGLRRVRSEGLSALGEGFYVNDHVTRGSNGQIIKDDPEIYATGTIGIGLGVDILIASGKLEGAIDGNLDFNLNDPNSDGKIRLVELQQNLSKGPLRIFDLHGELIARLTGSLSVGVWPLEKTWSKNFASVKLLEFDIPGGSDPGQSDPDTGTVAGDGTLTLVVGDDVDDSILVEHVAGTAFGETIKVTARGTTTTFTNVRKILAPASGGNDTITLAAGVLVPAELNGGDGNDTITGGDGRNTITGGAGNDSLVGRGNADNLSGNDGNDSITAGGGNDTAFGGEGNDTASGGEGNDKLLGEEGEDSLSGDAGLDTALGGDGNDRVSGGADKDSLQGDNGNDTLIGGEGDDMLDGGGRPPLRLPIDGIFDGIGGTDPVFGSLSALGEPVPTVENFKVADLDRIKLPYFTIVQGGGHDVVVGGGGNDILRDAGGNNILIGDYDNTFDPRPSALENRHEGADSFTAGTGNDSLWGDNRGDTNDADGPQADSARVTGDVIVTGGGADRVFAGSGGDSVQSGDGNDVVAGGTGDDTVRGGADDDSITGDAGADSLLGEAGVDTVFGQAGSDSIEGGTGDDSLAGGADGDTVRGQEGNDQIAGDGGNDHLYGDADVDQVHGNAGNDYVRGGSEADALFGDEGADQVFGDLGNDVIFGDRGQVVTGTGGTFTQASTIDPSIGDSDAIDAGAGDDVVFGGASADGIIGGLDADLIFGDFGSANRTAGTFTSIDTGAAAGGGADAIDAGAGDDTVVGGQGGDALLGGEDDDDLIGGHNVAGGADGGDTIDGGVGDDVIAGDNASIVRRADNLSRNIRALAGATLYTAAGAPNVTAAFQKNPNGAPGRDVTLFDHSAATSGDLFGSDSVAGGAGNDSVFGQLGNDVMQGDGAVSLTVSATVPSVTADTDGDDYMEGGGGGDVMFGNRGQDDLVGGSSSLFGLTNATRPDGADTIYGGAGLDIARNSTGDTTESGHARDADAIVGDNGNIYRIVVIATDGTSSYVAFNYDDYAGSLRIIPRAVQLLDYSADGNSANDAGTGDVLHGEAGDDAIHGASGDDFIFGDGQDDELYGESGGDWISGGSGEDGILGDDGRILTSRNGKAEPLYGIAASIQQTLSVKQLALVAMAFMTGKLSRAVDLEPFGIGGDDVIYGGLGDDSLHGGAGQDLMSGAEAMSEFYKPAVKPSLVFDQATGKFAVFNYSTPLARIANHPLNFEAFVGAPSNKVNDGNDALFGDAGNDWLVGGTQSDRLYGGYGNDVLNADDNLDTSGGANTTPDGAPFDDADIAYGGAGIDILIGNTTADRLIDWVGEFNNYYVPFSPFGQSTVIRQISTAAIDFLYALSRSDGADQTRVGAGLGSAARNGEPFGELGLVLQKDADWASQAGGPSGPQPQ